MKARYFALGALAVAVLGSLVALAPAQEKDKLEEIRSILAEMQRVQRIDVHDRHFKGHPLFEDCDFAKRCKESELDGKLHGLCAYQHEFQKDCDRGPRCKDKEARIEEQRAAFEKRVLERQAEAKTKK